MFRKIILAIACGFGLMVSQASAQTTPSDVFQVTSTISATVDAFHRAGFTEPRNIYLRLTDRQPRHVLQKAREVYVKVQVLRRVNGLPENPVTPIPVRDVRPADVKESVDLILNDLKELGNIYSVSTFQNAEFQDNKRPTDVYANLANISVSIDGLGIPATLPSDVYRLAQTVVSDLELLAAAKGIKQVSSASDASGKTPNDVYISVHELLGMLKILSEKPGYEIPGGVVLLNVERRRITPAYVMDVLNNVLAEIGAIKHVSGLTEPTNFAERKVGKTPSDVFNTIQHAKALVEALIKT